MIGPTKDNDPEWKEWLPFKSEVGFWASVGWMLIVTWFSLVWMRIKRTIYRR